MHHLAHILKYDDEKGEGNDCKQSPFHEEFIPKYL